MKKPGLFDSPQLTRREAIARVAVTSVGVASALSGSGALARLSAQAPADVLPTPPPATDPNFPMPPTWQRELRQLAPNVYAYVQGGGPAANNYGVSNTGVIAGTDYLLAIDATQGPIPARAFIAASKQATGGKEFGRLVNTHHHGDHVNGNQFFSHAEILSHPYCRQECVKAVASAPNNLATHAWNCRCDRRTKAGAALGHFQGRPDLLHWRYRGAVQIRRPRAHLGRHDGLFAAAQDSLCRRRCVFLGRAVCEQQLHHKVDRDLRQDHGMGCGHDRARPRADWR